jgi:chemotaxis protein MotB
MILQISTTLQINAEGVLEEWGSTWELSGARAARVARYFIENGMEADKITVKAFGETRPRFRNDSEIQRVRNNRVEVIIVPPEE